MIAAVLFDFYGTLARAVSWGPPLEEVLARHGLALDPAAHARWRAEGGDGIEHLEHSLDRERYVAWEQARLRRLVEGCGGSTDDDVVAADLYAASKDYALEAYDEVPAVLATLRERGLTLAVCSNWDWDLDGAIERAGLAGCFDVTVTSAQAGARKPHPRIYRHTLERCGVEPGAALFVGDSWGPDVEGPLAAGLRPIHVWRAEEWGDGREPPPIVDGARRVTDLRGVVDLLTRTGTST